MRSFNETLTRVPNGYPIAKGSDSPILLSAIGTLVVLLIVGLTAQILHLRRAGNQAGGLPSQASAVRPGLTSALEPQPLNSATASAPAGTRIGALGSVARRQIAAATSSALVFSSSVPLVN